MNEVGILSPPRVSGILLVSGLLIAVVAVVILLTSGAASVFSAMLQGALGEVAPYAATYRWLMLLWAVAWVVQLLGLGLLARLLARAGSEQLAIVAYALILLATILGVWHATFSMSVTLWAAEEAARMGQVPQLFEPLETWVDSGFRLAYILHLVGVAGFGWAILRCGLLPAWVGWAGIGWSVLWLVGYLVGAGAPGIVLIMPAVIGAALLL